MRGKARKKAKEKQSGVDEDFALLFRRFQPGQNRRGCMHGFIHSEDISDDLNIHDILETAAEAICISEKNNDRVGGAFENARSATDEKFPSLYKDAAALQNLSQAFLCIATDMLLDRRAGGTAAVTLTRFQIDFKAKTMFRGATILAFAEYLAFLLLPQSSRACLFRREKNGQLREEADQVFMFECKVLGSQVG